MRDEENHNNLQKNETRSFSSGAYLWRELDAYGETSHDVSEVLRMTQKLRREYTVGDEAFALAPACLLQALESGRNHLWHIKLANEQEHPL